MIIHPSGDYILQYSMNIRFAKENYQFIKNLIKTFKSKRKRYYSEKKSFPVCVTFLLPPGIKGLMRRNSMDLWKVCSSHHLARMGEINIKMYGEFTELRAQ